MCDLLFTSVNEKALFKFLYNNIPTKQSSVKFLLCFLYNLYNSFSSGQIHVTLKPINEFDKIICKL